MTDLLVDRSRVSMDELDELILDATWYWARARHGNDHCLSLYLPQYGTRFDHVEGSGGFACYTCRTFTDMREAWMAVYFNPMPSDCYMYVA